MRKALALLIVMMATAMVEGKGISSPYGVNFYRVGQMGWPDTVSSLYTPGSDGTVLVAYTTNHTATAWELTPDSITEALGEPTWNGQYPVWNGAMWSGKLWYDGGQWAMVYGEMVDNTDEWTDQVDVNGYVELRVEPYYHEDWWLHFVRDVSNEVVAATNIIPRRLCPELQSSHYHTLDGWCERSYFSTLGWREPAHDMRFAPIKGLVENRIVPTKRFVDKDKLWDVADELTALSENEWRSSPYIGPGTTNGYEHTITTMWSSKVFDDIYGGQLPQSIAWNDEGLLALTNKCAVLRGVIPTDIWGGEGSRGWAYEEMVPEYLYFGMPTSRYPRVSVPGHDFTFAEMCTNNTDVVVVDHINDRTHRHELFCHAAVNQTLAELDRTVCDVGHCNAALAIQNKYTKSTEYEYIGSFGDMGMTVEAYSGEWGTEGMVVFSCDSDIHIDMKRVTNRMDSTSHMITIADDNVSDKVAVTGNVLTHREGPYYNLGQGVGSAEIADACNYYEFPGVEGQEYIYSGYWVEVFDDHIELDVSVEGHVIACDFDFETTNHVNVIAMITNSYSTTIGICPDFTDSNGLPMSQAWGPSTHGRVGSCKDICTATIFESAPDASNLYFHASVQTRNAASMPLPYILTNEWNTHHAEVQRRIAEARPINWQQPESYIDYGDDAVSEYLQSFVVRSGRYQYHVEPRGGGTLVYSNSTWHAVYNPHGDNQAWIAFVPVDKQIEIEWDSSMIRVPIRPPIEEKVRYHWTTVIDWNWNSIRDN